MNLPDRAQIEPVGQCNLRCPMCSIRFRQNDPRHGPPAFIKWKLYVRLVDELATLQSLHLQGLGEPTMHPRFFDMVRYAANKHIRVTTSTNLTLLNGRMAEQCVRSGLDTVCVSIDATTAPLYERIRVNAHFDHIMRNLANLLEARARLGSQTPHIHMVTVLMRQNLSELPNLIRLAHQWSIDELFVQNLCHTFAQASLPAEYLPMREFVQAQTLLGYEPARVEAAFAQAHALAGQLGLRLRLPRLRPRQLTSETPGRERCDWPWTGIYITFQGHAWPCCMITTPDRVQLGNVAEHGVEAVWNGSRYRTFRDWLNSATPPGICRSCSLYLGIF